MYIGCRTYCIPIKEETQASNEYDNPLIGLPVHSIVDLLHAYISVLDFMSTHSLIFSWRNTCSWSKSRTRSVLYRRVRSLPIVNRRGHEPLRSRGGCIEGLRRSEREHNMGSPPSSFGIANINRVRGGIQRDNHIEAWFCLLDATASLVDPRARWPIRGRVNNTCGYLEPD